MNTNEIELALKLEGLKRVYHPWKCDNGTYDFVNEDGEVCYYNLGKPHDEESAWAELAERALA